MGKSPRESVLMNPADAAALGLEDGAPVRLRSDVGEWSGFVKLADMKERHVQTYWPETNVLIPRRYDPDSGEPDYNAMVTVEPEGTLPGTRPALVESEPETPPAPVITIAPGTT
jgi:anaerobic selenocysteine-containing dehydrogenase